MCKASLKQAIIVTATIMTHFVMRSYCEDTRTLEGIEVSTDPPVIPKHISWISGGAVTTPNPITNYSTACQDKPDLLNCFNDWDKSTVLFYLYNRGRNGSEIIRLGDADQLKESTYNKELPVKIIIHGYKQTGFSQFSHLIKEAYLNHGNETNVIVVDWRWLAGDHLYFNSAFNTRIAGERVGEFIVFLRKTRFIRSYKRVHMIGFSLGAHVAGYAAKHVRKIVRIRVSRITGLDPAGPGFSGSKISNRLDSTDAQFVDIIHTCVGRSGILQSIGHVDFFPNGGIDQPGCEWERLRSPFLRNCSHERAFQFFLESIRGEKFLACPCPNWEDFQTGSCRCNETTPGAEMMGEICSFRARGNKYLATTSDNHFLKSIYHIK